MMKRFIAILAIIFLLSSCAEREFEVRSLTNVGSEGGRFPTLTVTDEGTLLMAWLTPLDGEDGYALKSSEMDESNWSEPVTVFSGSDFFINWADYPSIFQVNGDTLVTHWPYKRGPGSYEYDVYIAVSYDRGVSWSEPIIPHGDGIPAEHGFVSFFRQSSGGVGMVWLDGRNMAPSEHGHGSGEMSLFTTFLSRDLNLGIEMSLDSRICECCPTAAATINGNTIIAYRDRSENEVRNIQIRRFINGEWEPSFAVNDDGWMIPGCPVNGPELAVYEDKLAIAWYTAPNGEAKVNLAFSEDMGASFSEPIRIDDGIPLGRVDLEWLNRSAVVVSWIEVTGDSAELKLRKVSLKGEVDSPLVVSKIDAGRGSGYPQMVNFQNELIFAWTEPGQWKIIMARLNKNSI